MSQQLIILNGDRRNLKYKKVDLITTNITRANKTNN